ncbi:amiloride-sensitive sodium channel subunit alpha-like isoform X2 [Varroa jacobsoni]|nr:amiloride-sensitive sodium channel subunit alpha-like isoform X2 [Varroa jacobsoni]
MAIVTRRRVNLCVKGTIWLVCVTGFLFQASRVVELYEKYEFTVTVFEEMRSNIEFPAVTICTEQWVNRSVLCKNHEPDCDLDSSSVTRLLYDYDLRADVSLEPEILFTCKLVSDAPGCSSVDCVGMIKRTHFRAPSYGCYTFDIHQHAQKHNPFFDCKTPWLYELHLRSMWDTNATARFSAVNKYPIIVHQKEVCPPERLSPIYLRQGLHYAISIEQKSFERLPPPVASRCMDYISMGYFSQFHGFKNYEICVQECVMARELKTCGCVRPDYEFAEYAYPDRMCNKRQRGPCSIQMVKIDAVGPCKSQCGQPCHELTYDVKLVGLHEDETKTPEGYSSFSVTISFGSDLQTVYEYSHTITAIEAFGYIGGYIGMWLGISLYSIYIVLEENLLKKGKDFIKKHCVKGSSGNRSKITPSPGNVTSMNRASR